MLWLLVSVSLLQSPPPQAPARDTSPSKPPTATAVIRGRITDKESGEPIPGALVGLRGGRDSRTSVAGADGRYEFTALPAGAYVVLANGGYERASHLTHVFGDPRPLESSLDVLNKTFLLKDGEVRNDVDVPLLRALAIEGRVIDTDGEPMTGVEVTASSVEHRLVDPLTRFTDDRGMFRLYGLPPGAYRVCANPKSGGSMYSLSTGGLERLLATCFPDVARPEDARPVEVVGPSVAPIEITVRTHVSFRVSGTIVDRAGRSVRDARASLLRVDRERGSFEGTVEPSGRFTISGVPPGKYLLHARTDTLSGPPPKGEAVAGFLPVTLEAGDVEGLVVPIGPGAVIGGHVTFLDGTPPSGQQLRMQVQATSGSGMAMASRLSFSNARVNQKYTFELTDLFLPSRIVAYELPEGWAVASIRYRGQEVKNIEVQFETDPDPRTLDIQLTSKVGEMSGKVLGESGAPVAMACIVAVAAAAPRPLAATAFAQTFAEGTAYRLPAVPAGTYTVAALSPFACIELQDNPALFDALGSALQQVTIAVGEHRALDLRLASLPDKR